MKQVIPFVKEIVFDNNIASMVSISLEHEDYIDGAEINGEFIVYGEYKASNDTTEVLSFKEVIPFNLLIPDNLIHDTVNVDIDDFCLKGPAHFSTISEWENFKWNEKFKNAKFDVNIDIDVLSTILITRT
jgi:hypothetical protein